MIMDRVSTGVQKKLDFFRPPKVFRFFCSPRGSVQV